MRLSDLPALGASFAGGIYVGTIDQPDGSRAALALLPDRAEDLTWQAATDWATCLDAQLPSRIMMVMIMRNTQSRPQGRWHWTCEEVNGLASTAWGCYFDYGLQHGACKSYDGSAVAVRLIHVTD